MMHDRGGRRRRAQRRHAVRRGGGAVVGALPAGLPPLHVPGWPGLEALGILVVPAMVIALVSFLETASSAKVENQRDGRRWNDNQDLIGQGLAKLAAGACAAPLP
jgi:SulP family sulfate permease